MFSFGVSCDSRIAQFWDVVGRELSDTAHTCCTATATALKEEFCCISVGCMENLYFDEVEATLVRNGGKKGWMRSVEHLLGFELKRMQTGSVPASAHLAMPTQVKSGGTRTSALVNESEDGAGRTLTDRLKRTAELDRIPFPIDGIKERITHTGDPAS